jgi:succinate dehydrogenase hydrophobic anchor subunit
MEFTPTNTLLFLMFVMVLLFTGIWSLFYPESIRRLVLKRESKRRWRITRWLELAPFLGSDQLRTKYLKSSSYVWTLRFTGVLCLVMVVFVLYVVIHSHH